MNTNLKVVIVDDNAFMIWGLKRLLQTERPGIQVVDTVSQRSEVLSSVRRHEPHIVLLEIATEGQSGLDLISLVSELSTAKVIVFTGMRDPLLDERVVLAGARGLVSKTEPVDVVLRAIEAVHNGELWLKRHVTAKIVDMLAAAYHQSSSRLSNSMFTPAEGRVIAAAVKYRGAPNKVIAHVLQMSANTFRNHLSTIYAKLGIHRRLDLVLYGIQNGLGESADLPAGGRGNAAADALLHEAAAPSAHEAEQKSPAPIQLAAPSAADAWAGGPVPLVRQESGAAPAEGNHRLSGMDAFLLKRLPGDPVPQRAPASVRLVKRLNPGPSRANRN